jgi:hypothetical protein
MLKKMTWILKFVKFLLRNMKSTIHKMSHISKTTHAITMKFSLNVNHYIWDSQNAKRTHFLSHGHIWHLWPNIRFLPSTVTEKNATEGRTEVKQYTPSPFGERGYKNIWILPQRFIIALRNISEKFIFWRLVIWIWNVSSV